jgi:FG-GAP-like repeat
MTAFALPGSGLPLQRTDFSADGKTDILFENAAGNDWIFLMNGATVVSGLPAPGVAPGWVLAGIGDFNGDGHADLLWRNTNDATQFWIYLMNGNAIIGGGSVTVTAGYLPTQIGDFDGDGNADILWENATGGRWFYFMNGATVSSSQPVPAAAPGWSIVGVGDFNGDGKADLLWNNGAAPQQYWIYLLNGASVIGGGSLVVAPGYTPTQIADFDGDSKADILWENGTSSRWMYFMNGATVTSAQPAPAAAPGWTVVGTGDFNGDAHADLLWQNGAVPTQFWIYTLNGTAITGGGSVTVAPGYSPRMR